MSDLGNTQKISSVVFFPALAVVILTLTSLIFPALFSSYFGMFGENLNPFESNNYSIFVIVSNVLIFGFGIAYYKKKIPSSFYNVFEKVRIFEISKRVTIISLVVILVVYIGLSTPELFVDESTQWQDYRILEIALGIWPFGSTDDIAIQEQNERYVRMFLLDV